MLQTPKPDSISSIKATPNSRPIRKIDRMLQNDNSNAQQDDGFSSASAGKHNWPLPDLHSLKCLSISYWSRKAS